MDEETMTADTGTVSIPVTSDQPYGDPKMWYQSMELWSAMIAIVAFILQGIYQTEVLPMGVQASIVTLWMFVLRGFRTHKPIAWTKTQFLKLKGIA